MVKTRQASETRATALSEAAVASSSFAIQPSSSPHPVRISHSSGARPNTVTDPFPDTSPAGRGAVTPSARSTAGNPSAPTRRLISAGRSGPLISAW